jgi:hypothetical protein
VVNTVGTCGERIGGVIMFHSMAESRNRDDQGLRTANLRVRANARVTNDTAIDKGKDDDIAWMRIGLHNIKNGSAGKLEGALRATNKMNMDIVLLTETKLMNDQYTKRDFRYDVVATKARLKAQGGVALIYRESEYWTVESGKCFGSDVISFQLAISAMFYRAVVQSVLLYGYETWVLPPKMLSKLEGSHIHIARRLTGRTPAYHRREDEWCGDKIRRAIDYRIV